MEKSNIQDIIKALQKMSKEDQDELLVALTTPEKKKKVRRKSYRKQGSTPKPNVTPDPPEAPSNSVSPAKGTPPPKDPTQRDPTQRDPTQRDPTQKMEAQRVPFKVGPRENTFETSRDFNSCKADIQQDKKLWGNNQPYERDRGSSTVVVNCSKCGQPTETQGNLVFKMPNGEYSFTCNKCTK